MMNRTPSPMQGTSKQQQMTTTPSRGKPKDSGSSSCRGPRRYQQEQETQQEELIWGAPPTSGIIIQPSTTKRDVKVWQAGTRVVECGKTGEFIEECEAINAQPKHR